MESKTISAMIHENRYLDLKSSGARGWGGESFDRRNKEWEEALAGLMANPVFPAPGAAVLEIGCGMGANALYLASKGYRASGVDISPTAILSARDQASDRRLAVAFAVADVSSFIPVQSGTLDAVIDGNCLHCIIGEARTRTLVEIRRVLKPGGVLYVSSMIGDPKQELAEGKFDRESRCQVVDGVPWRYMPHASELFAELEAAGFAIAHSKIKLNAWWDHLHCLAVKTAQT